MRGLFPPLFFKDISCWNWTYFAKIIILAAVFLIASSFENYSFQQHQIFPQYQKKAEAIVGGMTLEEKIGQMLLPTFTFLTAERGPNAIAEAQAAWFIEPDLFKLGRICGFDAISKYHIGAILQDASPLIYSGHDQSLPQWQKLTIMANLFYNGPSGTSLLLGNDSIHGDQHITGTVLFPHNIGLGATHHPQLVEKVGHWTQRNVRSSGFNWSYSPSVAVGHDYRWGRLYESYSANSHVLKALAAHYIHGLQAVVDKKFISGVLATPKHFIADGDTKNGIDEGYSFSKSLEECWKENGAGYEAAVNESAGSIMVSYSSLNNIPMHFGGAFNILDQFLHKGVQGSDDKIYQFEGFIVSDYVGVSRATSKCLQRKNTCGLLHYNEKLDLNCGYPQIINLTKHCQKCCLFSSKNKISIFELYVRAVAKAINAGIDMLMIANDAASVDPLDYEPKFPYKNESPLFYNKIGTVADAIATAVRSGLISQDRLNEAVLRIIRVKLSLSSSSMKPLTPEELIQEAGLSLQSAEQSLVLLKNEEQTLPVQSNTIEHVFLMGAFNDIGLQNGGWSVAWQGQKGNKYWTAGSSEKALAFATSILDGTRVILSNTPHYYEGEEAVLAANLHGISSKNSVAIVAIGESPYAEYNGDIDNGSPWYIRGALRGENIYNPLIQPKFLGIQFTDSQMDAIKRLREHGIKIVTVLFSGRPIVISQGKHAPLNHSDAFIAAFLPGTSGGQALANAIFGKYGFKSIKTTINQKSYSSNTLPFAWPASMKEIRTHHYTLFPIGYGLETQALNAKGEVIGVSKVVKVNP